MENKTKHIDLTELFPKHRGIPRLVTEWLNTNGLKSSYGKEYNLRIVLNVIHGQNDDVNVLLAITEVMKQLKAREAQAVKNLKQLQAA